MNVQYAKEVIELPAGPGGKAETLLMRLIRAGYYVDAHATASFFRCEQPPLICRRLWCLRHKAHAASSTGSLSTTGRRRSMC